MNKFASIILPIHDFSRPYESLVSSIFSQDHPDYELIIINTTSKSISDEIFQKIRNYKIINSFSSFPGKARNDGINEARGDFIAFLDSSTIPKSNWLSTGISALLNSNSDFIYGNAIATSNSYFQDLIKVSSYGSKPFNCLPGSIIKRTTLQTVGAMIPSVRAGEDIEWLNRMKFIKIPTTKFDEVIISYTGFPDNITAAIKKWYLYSQANATINIMTTQKFAYFALCILFILYFAYSWNFIYTESMWDRSAFFIPNLNKSLWIGLTSFYVLYRSAILPIKKGVKISFLFPFNWMPIGMIGLLMDLVKMPGRLRAAFYILRG